jgi:hypothetical protein
MDIHQPSSDKPLPFGNAQTTAREICAMDLRGALVPPEDVPKLVDKFWPVVAMEIQKGVVDPLWMLTSSELRALAEEYRDITGD